MKKAAVRALTTNAAVAQGVELAGQVSATAAEVLRTRREDQAITELEQGVCLPPARGRHPGYRTRTQTTSGD